MSHHYNPQQQKKFFEHAYQTGSDIWTHLEYGHNALDILPELHNDSLVLDIGTGRGLWPIELLDIGYRVIAIDYIPAVVNSFNKKMLSKRCDRRARALTANALDIPFLEQSFSLVTDIGTFQHLHPSHWNTYTEEVVRVTQKDGYYLNVSLSNDTQQFQGFFPSTSESKEFYKYGVLYYFFTNEEIVNIFKKHFKIITQKKETFKSQSDPSDDVVLTFTLMQKKAA